VRINGYEDLVEIGRGAFSTVYRAGSDRFSRDVAVKVFAGTIADPKLAEAFARECRLIGGLSGHPHVVTVHDSGLTDDQRPYIVMQHYACGSLADVVARDGVLTAAEVVAVAQAAGAALTVAHAAGVVHRDVKPHNLMLDQYGTVALGDFGIARPDDAHTTTLALTPAFAAPEVLTRGETGPRSDLYSLAATLFWLLTGAAPHRMRPGEPELAYLNRRVSVPADRLPATVPAGVAAVVEAALDVDPIRRPGSVAAFVESLRGAALTAGIAVPFALTGHDHAADTVRTPGPAPAQTTLPAPDDPTPGDPTPDPVPSPTPDAVPDDVPSLAQPVLGTTVPAGRFRHGSAPPARPLPVRPATPPAPAAATPPAAAPAAAATAPAASTPGPAAAAPASPSLPTGQADTVPDPLGSRRRPVIVGAGAVSIVLIAGALWAGGQLKGDQGRVRAVADTSTASATPSPTGATTTGGATTAEAGTTAGGAATGSPSATSSAAEWIAGRGASTATAAPRTPRASVVGASAAPGPVAVTTAAVTPGPASTTAPAGGGGQQPTTTAAAPPPPPPPPPTVYEATTQDGKTRPSFSNYQNFADRKDNIPGKQWIAVSCQAIMSSAPPPGASYTSHWYRVADSRWAGRWIQANSYHTRTRQGSTVTHSYQGDNAAQDWDHTIPLC